ncbi:AMP-binding protein [Coraliomargarita parva]|uniref:AMP-binding protein n=1 Tax=Coraliomargarita parva TaxID=3014050 RepID=UPI0022B51B68|nr:AMP-binding protein [Coraliomargarita parva]
MTDWIEARLAAFAERTAGHEAGKAYTYGQLLEGVRTLRDQLSSLPEPRILAVQTGSVIEGLIALLSMAPTTHTAVPIPDSLPEPLRQMMREVSHCDAILRTSGPTWTLENTTRNSTPKPELYQSLKGSGLVLFSSGTTGQPKAMLHELRALLDRYQTVQPRDDRTLLLLLFDHIGGLDTAFRSIFAGAFLAIPDQRTPNAIGQAIQTHAITVLPASPTFLNLLLLAGVQETYDCSSLRIIAYGAEAMPEPLLHRLIHAFPSVEFQQKFGTSETGSIRIKSAGNDSLEFRIQDSAIEWKIVDGELWLRSPSRILGYLNSPNDSLEAEGWYRTGDLVQETRPGTLRILGRTNTVINVGGQKVLPAEVEAALASLPEIEACEVYGVEDPIVGQALACRLVTQSEATAREWKKRIRQHCRGRLEPWKIPSLVQVVKELSLTHRMKRKDTSPGANDSRKAAR